MIEKKRNKEKVLWIVVQNYSNRKTNSKKKPQRKVKTTETNHGTVQIDCDALVDLYAVDTAYFMCIDLHE